MIRSFYNIFNKATGPDEFSTWTLPSIFIHKRTMSNGELNWACYLLVSCMVYELYQRSGLVMHSYRVILKMYQKSKIPRGRGVGY